MVFISYEVPHLWSPVYFFWTRRMAVGYFILLIFCNSCAFDCKTRPKGVKPFGFSGRNEELCCNVRPSLMHLIREQVVLFSLYISYYWLVFYKLCFFAGWYIVSRMSSTVVGVVWQSKEVSRTMLFPRSSFLMVDYQWKMDLYICFIRWEDLFHLLCHLNHVAADHFLRNITL